MLESLGYAEADRAEDADLILFNTCSIREKADTQFIAHLGHAKRLKRENPERIIGVGGCWAQSVKDEVFSRFPFVDVAFGPGQVHKLAEFLTSDRSVRRASSSSRASPAICPASARAISRPGCRSRPAATWRARTASCRRRAGARCRGRWRSSSTRCGPRRRRRARGDAAGPERQLLGAQPGGRGGRARSFAELLYAVDAIDGIDRIRYTSPHPSDMKRGRRRRARRAGVTVRAHPPPVAGRLVADSQGDAPHVLPRALPRPRRAHPRARARRRDHDRHHRRLPRRDGGGLRADARGLRAGRLRRRLHVRLLAAARHRGRRDHARASSRTR